MAGQPDDVPMLTLLLATCETALKTFRTPGSSIDPELVADVEKLAARARRDLEAMAPRARADSG
jgi:hypothetical protein